MVCDLWVKAAKLGDPGCRAAHRLTAAWTALPRWGPGPWPAVGVLLGGKRCREIVDGALKPGSCRLRINQRQNHVQPFMHLMLGNQQLPGNLPRREPGSA